MASRFQCLQTILVVITLVFAGSAMRGLDGDSANAQSSRSEPNQRQTNQTESSQLPPKALEASSESAEWLPESTIAVISFHDLGDLWRALEQSSVALELQELPDFKHLESNPKFAQLMTARRFIEGLFEQDVRDLAQDISAQPSILALDGSGSTAVVFKPSKGTYERVEKILSEFAGLAALTGRKGEKPGLKAVSYKGVTAFAADKARIAFHEGRIIVCSDNTIGKSILDRALGEVKSSLNDASWFQQARQWSAPLRLDNVAVSGLVDLQSLREAGKLKIPRGKDLGQELIVGGLLDVVEKAPYAAFSGEFAENQLAIRVAAPMLEKIDEKREYFFGEQQLSPAPAPIDLPDRILSFRWHRDFGAFWNMAPQLVTDDNVLAGLAKSESDLSTLFGGVTTIGDVFDLIDPQLEIVVCQPTYDTADKSVPDIKIPAISIVSKLRNREDGERILRLAFQQIVSFANLNAGKGGFPPMELMAEKVDGNLFVSAQYMQLKNMSNGNDYSSRSNLYKNFSPTLAISDQRAVLSSDRSVAEKILKAGRNSNAAVSTDNSVLELWPQELAAIADLNREVLIAQRMLQTGHSRDQAQAEIDSLLTLAKCFQSAAIRLEVSKDSMVLQATAQLTQ